MAAVAVPLAVITLTRLYELYKDEHPTDLKNSFGLMVMLAGTVFVPLLLAKWWVSYSDMVKAQSFSDRESHVFTADRVEFRFA